MIIGWKEVVLIVSIVISSAITILMLSGVQIPLITSWSVAAGVITVFGAIVLVLAGSTYISESVNASIIATLFAFLTIGLAFLAILLNDKFFFSMLAALLVGFWIVVLINDIRDKLVYHSKKSVKKRVLSS